MSSAVLTLEEIFAQYDGQWVAMEVTESRGVEPVAGIVFTHGTDEMEIARQVHAKGKEGKQLAMFHIHQGAIG